jgi:SAM-dependent methyltransferase
LLNHRDGLEPDDVYQLCSLMQKMVPPFLTMISLPKWLENSKKANNVELYQKKLIANQDKAKFIYYSLLNRLKKLLKKLLPVNDRKSTWSDYMQSNNNYSSEQASVKIDFIKQFLNKMNPQRVLDVGCNTGYFSFLAARHGISVVAIDSDDVVVGRVWKQAYAEKLDVLPLHVNITRPTPQMGWRNQECLSFLQRTKNYFDAVFMLAIIHHLLVSERIPLKEIIDLAAELTTKYVVIEYVDPEDSMFKILTRGREALYSYLTQEVFVEACQRRFDIVDSIKVAGSNRCLYVLYKKEIKNG